MEENICDDVKLLLFYNLFSFPTVGHMFEQSRHLEKVMLGYQAWYIHVLF